MHLISIGDTDRPTFAPKGQPPGYRKLQIPSLAHQIVRKAAEQLLQVIEISIRPG